MDQHETVPWVDFLLGGFSFSVAPAECAWADLANFCLRRSRVWSSPIDLRACRLDAFPPMRSLSASPVLDKFE